MYKTSAHPYSYLLNSIDDGESPPSHKEWLLVRSPLTLVYNLQAIFKDQINFNVKEKIPLHQFQMW